MLLYTQTVCPKCMVVKMWINESDKEVEIVNLDEHPEAREELREKGLAALPVMLVEGEYITDQAKMREVLGV